MNDDLLYLIANPIKKKRDYIEQNLDEEIIILLHKKYKEYYFDECIYEKICEINKKMIIDYTIKKFSERFINNIIEEIIDDDELIKNT